MDIKKWYLSLIFVSCLLLISGCGEKKKDTINPGTTEPQTNQPDRPQTPADAETTSDVSQTGKNEDTNDDKVDSTSPRAPESSAIVSNDSSTTKGKNDQNSSDDTSIPDPGAADAETYGQNPPINDQCSIDSQSSSAEGEKTTESFDLKTFLLNSSYSGTIEIMNITSGDGESSAAQATLTFSRALDPNLIRMELSFPDDMYRDVEYYMIDCGSTRFSPKRNKRHRVQLYDYKVQQPDNYGMLLDATAVEINEAPNPTIYESDALINLELSADLTSTEGTIGFIENNSRWVYKFVSFTRKAKD
ncbi:MAG: hypothetical protein A3F16_03190 [Deltaproteobacteria bacterium RIFCSPHIGHO2_12_FULL_43_9]|nr:MAG: hypothetical protein A3F16_03190 [Deltaproteobacteria bacterium RIFCSPHIGHO2_12_FULL_43_9]